MDEAKEKVIKRVENCIVEWDEYWDTLAPIIRREGTFAGMLKFYNMWYTHREMLVEALHNTKKEG